MQDLKTKTYFSKKQKDQKKHTKQLKINHNILLWIADILNSHHKL
jgi:hypothetical protein